MKIASKIMMTILLLAVTLMMSSLPAAATETKVIRITTNTDINPFIRYFATKKVYETGGPFTVRFDVKIENFKRTKPEGMVFINLHSKEGGTLPVTQIYWKTNTDGWVVDAKKTDGTYITFSNVTKGAIFDGVIQEYYHINFGVMYANATVYFRNFRVYDASNNLRYSFDTDPDLQGITNMKDITSPEPVVMALTFGDGTGVFDVLNEEQTASSTSSSASSGPIIEDPTPTISASSGSASSSAGISSEMGSEAGSGEASIADSTDVSSEEASVSADDSSAVSENSQDNSQEGGVSEPEDKGTSAGTVALIIGGVVLAGALAAVILYLTKKFPSQKKQ